jgi:hypothetical protein
MSSLPGHARITRLAVERLAAEGHPLIAALDPARVSARVVTRDVHDLLTLGHWRDVAQRRHFMRRFDGQSEREAYAECVDWIRARATHAAGALARQLEAAAGAAGAVPLRLDPPQALGDALHALQDSFAPGHVVREAGAGLHAGAIRRVLRYAGDEKRGHAAGDRAWRGAGAAGFSESGWHAVHASCDLLRAIADAAAGGPARGAVALEGFEPFRQRWLAAAAALSDARGGTIGFLRRLVG